MSRLFQGANFGDQFLPKLVVKSASNTKERGRSLAAMSIEPSNVKIDNRLQEISRYDGLKIACSRCENSTKVTYAYTELLKVPPSFKTVETLLASN